MAIATKVRDEAEARRMLEGGTTYPDMVEFYREKYGDETSVSMWSSWGCRRGIEPRVVRDRSLIPWRVRPAHDGRRVLVMLRAEARRRAGAPVSARLDIESRAFVDRLKREGLVIEYRPGTEEGFFRVPRNASDDDIVRKPA